VASTTLLLKHGAPVNLPDADGQTPLHLAIQAGRLDTAEALLAAGANRNAKNKDNETPMHIAAKCTATPRATSPRLLPVADLLRARLDVQASAASFHQRGRAAAAARGRVVHRRGPQRAVPAAGGRRNGQHGRPQGAAALRGPQVARTPGAAAPPATEITDAPAASSRHHLYFGRISSPRTRMTAGGRRCTPPPRTAICLRWSTSCRRWSSPRAAPWACSPARSTALTARTTWATRRCTSPSTAATSTARATSSFEVRRPRTCRSGAALVLTMAGCSCPCASSHPGAKVDAKAQFFESTLMHHTAMDTLIGLQGLSTLLTTLSGWCVGRARATTDMVVWHSRRAWSPPSVGRGRQAAGAAGVDPGAVYGRRVPALCAAARDAGHDPQSGADEQLIMPSSLTLLYRGLLLHRPVA